MLPMECQRCRSTNHRAAVTNGLLPDQIVRKRVCADCGHKWFTVEVTVPDYLVGWSALHQKKPVLRAPVELKTGHTQQRVGHVEAQDQIAPLLEANRRRAEAAERRYGV